MSTQNTISREEQLENTTFETVSATDTMELLSMIAIQYVHYHITDFELLEGGKEIKVGFHPKRLKKPEQSVNKQGNLSSATKKEIMRLDEQITKLEVKVEVLKQTVKIYESVMEQLDEEITSEKTVQIYRRVIDKDKKIYGPITTRIVDKSLDKE